MLHQGQRADSPKLGLPHDLFRGTVTKSPVRLGLAHAPGTGNPEAQNSPYAGMFEFRLYVPVIRASANT